MHYLGIKKQRDATAIIAEHEQQRLQLWLVYRPVFKCKHTMPARAQMEDKEGS